MVASEIPALANDTVAWAQERDRVASDSASHGPTSVRRVDGVRDVRVSRHVSRGDPKQRFPDLELKGRAFQQQAYLILAGTPEGSLGCLSGGRCAFLEPGV